MIATQTFHLLAGLSWDPAIRGILTVVLGCAILLGSIYMILATNTGIRLGLLLSCAGFFGWMVILTLTWWSQPPGIGPAGGVLPHWEAQDIVVQGATSEIEPANILPTDLPSAASFVERCPALEGQVPATPVLSDIAGVNLPEITCNDGTPLVGKLLVPGRDQMNGWKLV